MNTRSNERRWKPLKRSWVGLLFTLFLAPAAYAQEGPAYVGSQRCAGCHQDAAQQWQHSHHAKAWRPVGVDSVLADFNGTAFSGGGLAARFRTGPQGGYYIEVKEKDGITTEYRVHSVVGVEPLQQYLLETEPGKLQSFDVVWDTKQGAWFHLYPDMVLPPDDGLHWTGPYKNWNARCAECHATGYEKNYDPATGRYASTQAELGVGCEACHGPGSRHLDWAAGKAVPATAPATDAATDRFGFTQGFDATEATIQQCAACHARREPFLAQSPLPGTPFHDAYEVALLRPGLYQPDGQILDEVYVYGSFLQSKMYRAGVGCLDCHAAHTAQLVAPGNGLCTQCHNPRGNPAYPQLRRAAYDSPAHHFHAPGTQAAQCKSCHMAERLYMGNDWRADHSFRVPRPDLSQETGAQDACSGCHDDRGSAWAAERIRDWYPQREPRQLHYGQVLARGQRDPAAAASELAGLALDREQPGIVRATALWLLGRAGESRIADRLEPLLGDPDPLVRRAAIGAQRLAPPQTRVLRVTGLLDDPVRSVRMAAAEAMLGAPIARLSPDLERDYRIANREWQASLASRLEFPETHLVLGGIALTMRHLEGARAAFEEVVAMDPQRVEAWVMLVRLAAATEGAGETRKVIERALAKNASHPVLQQLDRELRATER